MSVEATINPQIRLCIIIEPDSTGHRWHHVQWIAQANFAICEAASLTSFIDLFRFGGVVANALAKGSDI
ncbi:hypothetical protein GCT13_38720 [Paraburkholderia sp. CNPSo 3157]|uniref:Uncharacterized protein n=1 Tax=Paraburkholderia franconis TaxID=2654983 RepID=A0A7X1NIR1_9BURK|nr:hypothetical protein [Paraburkholderia franconis]MPW22597.1 hypothetical protein [Paraburkholderia franconis]